MRTFRGAVCLLVALSTVASLARAEEKGAAGKFIRGMHFRIPPPPAPSPASSGNGG